KPAASQRSREWGSPPIRPGMSVASAEEVATTNMGGLARHDEINARSKGAAVSPAVCAGNGVPRVVGLSRRARNRRTDRRVELRFELSGPGRAAVRLLRLVTMLD